MLHKDALWRIYVATNNKTYLSLNVKFPTFLSDCDYMWNFMKDFRISDSRACACVQTDGHDESNKHFPKCYLQRTAYISKDIPVE